MSSNEKEFSSNEYLGINFIKRNNSVNVIHNNKNENSSAKINCKNLNNEKDIGGLKNIVSKVKNKLNINNKFSNLVGVDNSSKDCLISNVHKDNKKPFTEEDLIIKPNGLTSSNNTAQIDADVNAMQSAILTDVQDDKLPGMQSAMLSGASGSEEMLKNSLVLEKNAALNNTLNTSGSMQKTSSESGLGLNEESNNSVGGIKGLNQFFQNLQLFKLFKNKNSKVAVLIVILSILLVMFLNLSTNSSSASKDNLKENFNSIDYVSSSNYVKNLEVKLIEVLSQIRGAGSVNVMVTLESGPELKIANSIDERTNTSSNSSTTTTSITVIENPIIISNNGKSQPLVLMEIMPVVKGVIVVAQGASNTKVKLELLQAIQALLNVSNDNIQIYAGI